MDAAFWFLRLDGLSEIVALMCVHVDDLLFTGNDQAWKVFLELGRELGFGSIEEDDFVWCGKRMQREPSTRTIRISMEAYHQNMEPIPVSQSRRQELHDECTPREVHQLRQACGGLQWLVAQLRCDMSCPVSFVQSEMAEPKVSSLLRASQVVVECKRSPDWYLEFGPICLKSGGLLEVSDAALGNVSQAGTDQCATEDKVHSQA